MDDGRTGLLLLAAAPLGNPGDASARLREALATVELIAAEDTRRLRRLAAALEVPLTARVVSCYDAVEASRAVELVEALGAGTDVLLVTDAGMPSVSDPGYRVVRAAVEAGLPVTCLPGPSAVTTALALSGLPTDRFCFEGFPPRRPAERRRVLAELAEEPRTLVFFEAPHRLAAMLADAAAAFGPDREAVVCRELTKTYEEVRREPLGALAEWAEAGVRGEITVVVAGRPAPRRDPDAAFSAAELEGLAEAVATRTAAGEDRREALSAVARAAGVPRRVLYDAVVRRNRAE